MVGYLLVQAFQGDRDSRVSIKPPIGPDQHLQTQTFHAGMRAREDIKNALCHANPPAHGQAETHWKGVTGEA